MSTVEVIQEGDLVLVREIGPILIQVGGPATTAIFQGQASSGLVPDPGAVDDAFVLTANGLWGPQAGAGGGNMLKSVYDPGLVEGDAFDMDNMVEGTTTKILTGTERTKLTGIETAATADQSDAEIATAYGNQVGQVSSPEKTAGTELGLRTYSPKDVADMATVHGGVGDAIIGPGSSTDEAVARFDGTTGKLAQNSAVTIDDSGNIATAGTVDGRDVSVDGTKLDGIETAATADQTDAEIRTAYENEIPQASQAEAEAGALTVDRRWTPERVKQAIASLPVNILPEFSLESGILTGGEVTVNGSDPAHFDVAAGTGVVVDWTTPGAPVRTLVIWSAFLDQTATGIATDFFTSLSINAAGSLVQSPGEVTTPQQRRQRINLQAIVHVDFSTITSLSTSSFPAYEQISAALDYISALGAINIGNGYTFAGANLQFDKAAGTTTLPFLNRSNDLQSPTVKVDVAQDPVAAFVESHRDGASGYTLLVGVTAIDPNLWDDGSGTLATLANNKWSIRRMYFISANGLTTVTYGQYEYQSLATAEAALFTELLDLDPTLDDVAAWNAALIVKKGATDLSDISQAKFIPIDIGITGGGTGTINHGGLSGLDQDDHLLYHLTDGTRPMTGALDMGSSNITNVGTVDGRNVSVDGTKIDGIEAGATQDQTDAEIKTGYENNADTNEFSDAEQTKLAGIATAANLYVHPNHIGDVTSTGDGSTLISNDAVTTAKILNANVTLAKIANIATARLLGRNTAGSGVTEELTAATAKTLLAIALSDVSIDQQLDMGAHSAHFDLQALAFSATPTINWQLGNKAAMTLTANVTATTFTDPGGACNLLIKLTQDTTGGFTFAWPAAMKWAGGSAPTLSTPANSIDIISIFFDGTTYYGSVNKAFS